MEGLQNSVQINELFEGAQSFGGDENAQNPLEDFKFEAEAEAAVIEANGENQVVPPNTETNVEAQGQATDAPDATSEIAVPEKVEDVVDYKSLASEYSKSINLGYDAEKELLSKINTREEYEEIVGKMVSRDEFINSNVSALIQDNPLFVSVLNGNANPLEVIQHSVKASLGDFYTDAQYDAIVETLYVDGALTEKGKETVAKVTQLYNSQYQNIVSKANEYSDKTYSEKKAHQNSLKEAVKSTKLLGAIVPSDEFQKELIEEVEKGTYFDNINKALQDNSTKAETELLLAAISNPRLRGILARQIYEFGANSKKNEILKAKL